MKISNPYIPAWLDDANIRPIPFRILCHIYRRSGKSGWCFESQSRMAKHLGLHRDTLIKHLRWLRKNNYLFERRVSGNRVHFRVNCPSKWVVDNSTIPEDFETDEDENDQHLSEESGQPNKGNPSQVKKVRGKEKSSLPTFEEYEERAKKIGYFYLCPEDYRTTFPMVLRDIEAKGEDWKNRQDVYYQRKRGWMRDKGEDPDAIIRQKKRALRLPEPPVPNWKEWGAEILRETGRSVEQVNMVTSKTNWKDVDHRFREFFWEEAQKRGII